MSHLEINNLAQPPNRLKGKNTMNTIRRNLTLKLFTLTALVLTTIFPSAITNHVFAATPALTPEVAGIHFISLTTWHIGDNGAGDLPGTYAGASKIFDITATDYDLTKPAVITLRVKDVNSPCNLVMFRSYANGQYDDTVHVANPIPNHTEDLDDWHTVTLEVPANTFKANATNRLWFVARDSNCGYGALDDFLIDTVVLHYVRK